MNISQLLESLKDPSAVLSLGEKLLVGVSVAILSMTVVFIILVMIALIITILQKDRSGKKEVKSEVNLENEVVEIQQSNNEDFGELVSVITAAIAATTGNSTNNIIVRKIQRSNNNKTNWERMAKNTTK
ncbi:OadG family protein [Paraclostridium bifermentans]|uniref:OadG family protein n=1 Tax=Paraclostridium bifermentans TaxID=1490 RepID=UPI00359C3597